MAFPQALQAGIDELLAGVDPRSLERSARALSEAYRAGGSQASRAARSSADVAAYVATRAPATYAAVAAVLRQAALVRPGWLPTSVLDLGSGPGVAAWASLETWPGVEEVTLVDAEPEMMRAARVLARRGAAALRDAKTVVGELAAHAGRADLVVVSYVVGELGPGALRDVVGRAWELTGDTLVVVEPGTTAGYLRILAAREAALEQGASTLAPCPHDRACPLEAGDWCHFAERLPRTRAHRLAKSAERGFEDEKLSYAVLTRSRHPRPSGRVLRRPDLRPGHVVLHLCTPEGIERRTVSRREGDAYRRARKLSWGDAL